MTLNIGFCLPSVYSLSGGGNGVRVQALRQAEALERAGHRVVRLNPWETFTAGSLDLVQYFMGGFHVFNIEGAKPNAVKNLVFAPIIDCNEPNWRYRLAATAGRFHPKFYTIPGEIRKQALRSSLIICRSSHEKERVCHGLGIDPQRVPSEIVLNGVDLPEAVDPEAVCRNLGLPEEFVLHVSAYTQERKNVIKLIEAVAPTGLPLVIAGTSTQGSVLNNIARLQTIHNNLRLLGFQDIQTLRSLYSACKVFCLPSWHEGTGLVALEAASYGAEIVITKNGGPVDYFGNLAEYVDPADVSGIRSAVMNAWKRPRSKLLSQHVISKLTWDRSAETLVAAYRTHLQL